MEAVSFKKMHGSGNDFILMDNRSRLIPPSKGPETARRLCRRKFSVGADGLILIEDSKQAHYRWRFYNADGSEAEMCGNGGRCAARFAVLEGIAPPEHSFETKAGIIKASVDGARVKIQLPGPSNISLDESLELRTEAVTAHHLNTGVPHTCLFVDDVHSVPVFEWGRLIRHHERFRPEGTNADFVQVVSEDELFVRTYERGVEDETMACGTGAVAAALAAGLKGLVKSPVRIRTWGGEVLTVHFTLEEGGIREVFLEGEAVVVYSGLLDGDQKI